MNGRYILTAALEAIFVALLCAYPIAAAFVPAGQAPIYATWLRTAAVLSLALIVYSLLPKPTLLRRANWFVLPFLAALTILFSASRYENVAENFGWVLLFTVFTGGVPLLLPIGFMVLHMRACRANDTQLGTPSDVPASQGRG